MRREIFNGIADDEEKAVKAFVNQNKESALKIKPKVCVTVPSLSHQPIPSHIVNSPLSHPFYPPKHLFSSQAYCQHEAWDVEFSRALVSQRVRVPPSRPLVGCSAC